VIVSVTGFPFGLCLLLFAIGLVGCSLSVLGAILGRFLSPACSSGVAILITLDVVVVGPLVRALLSR
jgi:hypothetical protein